ncbi:MAG: CDP-glycerol glycerophosphotransferase family protein [Candidatus Marinimicrobia bacterium]|nr:CDP-glycerol glycerophosphotransferase family protein [Candidatus Neomarinimicrobiota bacterium]
MKKIKVLFNLHHLYYLPQFLPVVEAMKTNDRFDIFFSAPMDKERIEYNLITKVLGTWKNKFISGETEEHRIENILNENFDITVFGKSAHAERYCSPDTLAVLLYHGIGVKSCYYTDYNPRINVRYIEGDYRKNEFFRRKIDTELVVTGFPKLDVMKKENHPLKNQLDLDPSKKTILYAPTFYPSSIEVFGEKLGNLTRNFNLIIKLHHFSWVLKKYSHQKTLMEKLTKTYPHIHLMPAEFTNIAEIYNLSDVLLTEASSTLFEYLATENPVIVCTFVHLRWNHRLFPSRFNKRMDQEISSQLDFVYKLKKPGKLSSLVNKAILEKPTRKKILQTRQKDLLGIVDGNAARRVVEDLIKRIDAK